MCGFGSRALYVSSQRGDGNANKTKEKREEKKRCNAAFNSKFHSTDFTSPQFHYIIYECGPIAPQRYIPALVSLCAGMISLARQ